ncbi:hypothetical protein GCM10023238_28560 [Streptomyces heliomycini]
MFVDHDDWLGDEALERMYDYGKANDADVVVGKMAGIGRPVPQSCSGSTGRARRWRERAVDRQPHPRTRCSGGSSSNSTACASRRAAAGWRTNVFVVEAYLRARSVAVLGDYLCYYTSPATTAPTPASSASTRRLLQQPHASPRRGRGAHRARLRTSCSAAGCATRWSSGLRGNRLLKLPEDYAEELYREIRGVVTERFGPGVFARSPPTQRVVAGLIAADLYEDVRALARWEAGIRPTGTLDSLTWRTAS